jgi:hypothetical protein
VRGCRVRKDAAPRKLSEKTVSLVTVRISRASHFGA